MQAVCWKWQRDDGGYCPYLPEDSSTLETAHASGNGQCTLGQYVVDFKKLIQHRKAGGGEELLCRGSDLKFHLVIEVWYCYCVLSLA